MSKVLITIILTVAQALKNANRFHWKGNSSCLYWRDSFVIWVWKLAEAD